VADSPIPDVDLRTDVHHQLPYLRVE
jgi:hypothetical protein